jgi:hypothetical protein
MNVIDMMLEIDFVANRVLPIAMLPNRLFATPATGFIANAVQLGFAMFGKPGFNQPPTQGKIGIARGQTPNTMQMIREHYNRLNDKRPGLTHRAKRTAQHFNGTRVGQNR